MKHLFFVAVASGIFSGTTFSANAQAHANSGKFATGSKTQTAPKFIEDIEIAPATGNGAAAAPVSEEIAVPASQPVTNPAPANGHLSGSIEACSALQFKYAMMTDRDVESITNLSLYRFIDNWWAVRYQYGGSDHNGVDCSAFTAKLISEVYGLTVPRTAKDQYDLCEKLDTSELKEGDLVFFNIRRGVSHVGLYLGNNYFVHSSVSGGVTISTLTDDYYNKRFISGGRIASPQTPAGNNQAVAKQPIN